MITGSSIKALTWSARALSIVLTVLFFVFFFYDPIAEITTDEIILLLFFPFTFIVGYVVAWNRPLTGSWIILSGFAGFYIAHYFQTGSFPEGWGFFMFIIPAIFYLLTFVFKKSVRV